MDISSERITQILNEVAFLGEASADPELEATKFAILIEDVFGIRLSDNDIDPEVIGCSDALSTLLNSLLRGPA